MKNNYLQTITEYIEYDGIWHKKDKDGNCSPFIMADLEELLREKREGIIDILKDTLVDIHMAKECDMAYLDLAEEKIKERLNKINK